MVASPDESSSSSIPSPNADAAAVSAIHRHIDERTTAFARDTGIACPPGCGRCCHSPDVESSVADLLPLAAEIVARGDGAVLLERLRERGPDRRCILFEPDPADAARGRCTMYAWRPSICRLFGFAGRRDADGRPQFTPCRVHAATSPATTAAATASVRAGVVALPIFGDLAPQAAAAAPDAPADLRPINDALRAAIERVGLAQRLAALAADETQDDDGTPGRPTTPRRPLRPAA